MNKISLTAIIPVFNEQSTVLESVNRLLSVEEVDQIFIVDDGSTDNSPDILKNIELENDNVTLFTNKPNNGKGHAIKSVFQHLNTDYAVIHDSDLEYNPNNISDLCKKINTEKSNFILGSRFLDNSKIQIYIRTFYANKILSRLFSFIYRVKITDIATCYKMMPSDYLKNTNFIENGFAIEIELVAKFLKYHSLITEVKIDYSARSYKDGKKIKLSDGFLYLYTIFKYRYL